MYAVHPENLDGDICTHYAYAFIGINDNGEVRHLDEHVDNTMYTLEKFVKIRSEKSHSPKMLVALGGWNEGSERYSNVIGNPTLRTNLVVSLYNFVYKWRLDGVSIDWHFPATRGGYPQDYVSFFF